MWKDGHLNKKLLWVSGKLNLGRLDGGSRPSLKQPQPTPMEIVSVKQKVKIDNRPRIKIEVFGIQINALIDTGAETTFVGPRIQRICQQNGIPVMQDNLPIASLANGSTNPVQGSIYRNR